MANPFSKAYRSLKRWLGDRTKFDTLTAVTIILYLIAILGALAAVFSSTDWAGGLSRAFIITAIVVPFFSIAIAFMLQVITQRYDTFREVFRVSEQSRFMRLFEESLSPQLTGSAGRRVIDSRYSVLLRLMYGKLGSEMEAKLQNLRDNAIIEAFQNYWEFCALFYTVARDCAECTSLIEIRNYEHDEMKTYINMQKRELLDRKIPVSRTFLFKTHLIGADETYFRTLCLHQAEQGFRLYYVVFSEIAPRLSPELEVELYQDYALIDRDILQLGTSSNISAQKVLYYEFHLLHNVDYSEYPDRIRQLFIPPNSGTNYLLKIQSSRHRLSDYNWGDITPEDNLIIKRRFAEFETGNPGRLIDQRTQP